MAGKRLTDSIVIDPDTTVITSASKKAEATVTFKKTFGFHPLAAGCANTPAATRRVETARRANRRTVTKN
ncbi:hypothetical protein [Streptomyces sp. NPDC058294]|uniref:hypothetical protein n=1 Tax=Streptomyces sp. NPDC058294 TaxID=3346430 RepID=UPI0036EAEAEC